MSWTITPRFTQWTPASITTALWLDANDSATVIQSGGAVTTWNDKSGNSAMPPLTAIPPTALLA